MGNACAAPRASPAALPASGSPLLLPGDKAPAATDGRLPEAPLLLVPFPREQVTAQSLIWSQAVTWSYKAFTSSCAQGSVVIIVTMGRIYVTLTGYQALSILSLTEFKAASWGVIPSISWKRKLRLRNIVKFAQGPTSAPTHSRNPVNRTSSFLLRYGHLSNSTAAFLWGKKPLGVHFKDPPLIKMAR